MAKPRLNFNPSPTFKGIVNILGQGAPAPVPVEFNFVYRTKDQAIEWETNEVPRLHAEGGNVAVLQSMCTGWDQEQPWDTETLQRFDQLYMGGVKQIREDYRSLLTGARLGN